MPTRSLLASTLALTALLGLAAPAAWADAPPERRTPSQIALKRLASPVLAEREAAVRTLVDLLPGVRGQVIEALPGSPWSIQLHLIEVLAQDGSETAVQALLTHLVRTEATQAALIQRLLARLPEAAARLLAAWRADPAAFVKRAGDAPEGAERLRGLVLLLRRAEIEGLFLGRKSKSGSTGYYKGQYAVLRGKGLEPDFRDHALAVVTGIALDEALPTAGIYTSGVYRFVRPHLVDEWELRSMALNAVGELATADDHLVVTRLEDRLIQLMRERTELQARMRIRYREAGGDYDSKLFQDALLEWDDALGEYLDHLSCLHQIEPVRYAGFVRRFVEELRGYTWPFMPIRRWSYIAALLIRAGWYDEAIDAYRTVIRMRGSKALGYYNMACAAASASRKVGLSKARRTAYVDDALMYLSLSVDYGWSDVAWMNEDRDLEALREERANAYAHIVERIKAEWHVPKKR
ncbi:MAG: hypothetical protein QNJ90_10960 [Planctomycetota bacterium]|nr:hypothetical protein [Planctomycetota bacterium]